MAIKSQAESPRESQRIPFVGVRTSRGTGTVDQRYVNVYVDKIHNAVTQQDRAYLVKRPGLAADTRPSGANATGRGIWYWPGTDKNYTVFDNKIYSNTTDLGVTLSASSGRCWFAETPQTFGTGQRLLVSDGTKLYSINTSDTVTTISTSSDAQFPTSNLGPVLFFDSYVVLAKANGEIWNSDVDTEASWTSTSFLAAEMFGDDLEGIARQKDQIIGLGKQALEFFFNNQGSTGSPFQRIDQNAIQVGLASKNGLAQMGDLILFPAKTKNEQYSVWLVDGVSTIKKISTPTEERLLAGEGSSISSCTAFLIRSQGHIFYFLNLSSANRTLVYDVTLDRWDEAQDSSGNKFNCISGTEKNGVIYLQDATNGRTYTYSPTTYQDNGSNFTVTIQTSKVDHETSNCKHSHGLFIEGDLTTGNLAVSFSNDDYTTFNTARNIDLSRARRYLPRLGKYYQRAWKFTYADNYALRLEAFEELFDIGTH